MGTAAENIKTNDSDLAEQFRSDLSQKGYGELPHGIHERWSNEVFTQFNRCIEVVTSDKSGALADALTYQSDKSGCGNYFFVERVPGHTNLAEGDRGSKARERKIEFHWGPQTWQRIMAELGPSKVPREVRTFLTTCEDLFAYHVRPIFEAGANFMGVADLMIPPPNATKSARQILRFLSYLEGFAVPHEDRSTLTATVIETKPGLYGAATHKRAVDLSADERLAFVEEAKKNPLDYRPGYSKLFLGAGALKLAEALPGRALDYPRLVHGVQYDYVVGPNDTCSQAGADDNCQILNPERGTEHRYALVGFANVLPVVDEYGYKVPDQTYTKWFSETE